MPRRGGVIAVCVAIAIAALVVASATTQAGKEHDKGKGQCDSFFAHLFLLLLI